MELVIEDQSPSNTPNTSNTSIKCKRKLKIRKLSVRHPSLMCSGAETTYTDQDTDRNNDRDANINHIIHHGPTSTPNPILYRKALSRPKHKCTTCSKQFIRKRDYTLHTQFCGMKSMNVLAADEYDNMNLPSYRELVNIVGILSKKCEIMEEQLRELNKHKKKKINILEWLNQNVVGGENDPTGQSFERPSWQLWCNTIPELITQDHLEYMFSSSYTDSILYILKHALPIDSIMSHPIRCFKQHKGVFFVFVVEAGAGAETGAQSGHDNRPKMYWQKANEEVFEQIWSRINLGIMRQFQEWKKEHQERLERDDDFYQLYLERMKMVLGGKKPLEQSKSIISQKLFNYLQYDIQNIVEYEFVF